MLFVSVLGMPRGTTDDRRINELARERRGLVSSSGLKQLEVSVGAIRSRRENGWLQPVFDGVYLVGGAVLDQPALRQAGLLWNGPSSTLIRSSAVESREVLPERLGHITIGRPTKAPNRGIRTLIRMDDGNFGVMTVREIALSDGEREVVDGAACSTVARSLVDIAGYEPHNFEKAWRQADFLDLLDLVELGRACGRGRRGSGLVRKKLADHVEVERGLHGLDSPAELDAIRAVLAAGAPHPLVNYWLGVCGKRYRLDLYWPHLRLVVEIDGWAGHKSRESFESDRQRDDDLLTAGILTMRFSARRAEREPLVVAERILAQIAVREAALHREQRAA